MESAWCSQRETSTHLSATPPPAAQHLAAPRRRTDSARRQSAAAATPARRWWLPCGRAAVARYLKRSRAGPPASHLLPASCSVIDVRGYPQLQQSASVASLHGSQQRPAALLQMQMQRLSAWLAVGWSFPAKCFERCVGKTVRQCCPALPPLVRCSAITISCQDLRFSKRRGTFYRTHLCCLGIVVQQGA